MKYTIQKPTRYKLRRLLKELNIYTSFMNGESYVIFYVYDFNAFENFIKAIKEIGVKLKFDSSLVKIVFATKFYDKASGQLVSCCEGISLQMLRPKIKIKDNDYTLTQPELRLNVQWMGRKFSRLEDKPFYLVKGVKYRIVK